MEEIGSMHFQIPNVQDVKNEDISTINLHLLVYSVSSFTDGVPIFLLLIFFNWAVFPTVLSSVYPICSLFWLVANSFRLNACPVLTSCLNFTDVFFLWYSSWYSFSWLKMSKPLWFLNKNLCWIMLCYINLKVFGAFSLWDSWLYAFLTFCYSYSCFGFILFFDVFIMWEICLFVFAHFYGFNR